MSRKEKEANKRSKKLLVVILIILIIAIGVLAILKINKSKNENIINNEVQEQETHKIDEKNVEILADGSKLNISEKLNQNKKLEDLEIKNIQLIYRNGVTNILADVVNNGEQTYKNTKVDITLLDEQENALYKIRGVIEETEAGKTSKLNTSITADFANAYDLTITKVK